MVGLQNLKNFEIKGGFTVESHCSFTQWLPSSRSTFFSVLDPTFFSVSDPHKFMRIRIQDPLNVQMDPDPDPLFFLFRSGSKGGKIKEDNLNKQIFN